MDAPLADPISEGRRLVTAATERAVQVRLTGGVGVACVCSSASLPPLKREFKDIDIVGLSRQSKQIGELLEDLGYVADHPFNSVNGDRRLLYHDQINHRQFDVFLDEVHLCHHIDLRGRLEHDQPSLTVSDLLLMKLQVFETNVKDYTDIISLCVDHPVGVDPAHIDVGYIGGLVANDWGLWRTITIVAGRTREYVRAMERFPGTDLAETRLGELLEKLETVPKSRKWGLRARVGERVRWYNLPE